VFVFGALINAFAMIGPVHQLEEWLATTLATRSEPLILGLMFAAGLVFAPALMLGGAAAATRALTDPRLSVRQIAMRYAYGLVPLGFGVWLAHYGFHFLTGALTIVPVTQSAAIDLVGWPPMGQPWWRWTGMRPGSVFPIQLGCILLGAAGSLGVTHLISMRDYFDHPRRASIAWTVVIVALAAAAIWVLFQPMEMRGMGFNA
jgi:hypothetical protein